MTTDEARAVLKALDDVGIHAVEDMGTLRADRTILKVNIRGENNEVYGYGIERSRFHDPKIMDDGAREGARRIKEYLDDLGIKVAIE